MVARKQEGLKGLRKSSKARGDDVTLTRWKKEGPEKPIQLWLPGTRFKAAIGDGSSLFPKSRQPPSTRMLVSGYNNVKIGRDVRKGRLFRGYYIYTLSFEERASCPRSCYHWDTCYGNNMPFAKRVDHRDFEHLALALIANVDYLDSKIDMPQTKLSAHPRKGVLVRLHALGDFFSVPYVRLWAGLLRAYPRLACFGYTAWMPETEIGAEIAAVKEEFGRRFAIRWSGREGADGTVTYNSKCPDTVIACPEQTDRTACCATCALCWETDKPIGFKQH